MTEPIERAEELRLDACLSEVSGGGPSADLAERTIAALRTAGQAPTGEDAGRPRWWLAAALALFGLGVVAAVSWLQHNDDTRSSATEQEREPEPPDAQDPAKKKADADVGRWIRELELPARRAAAQRALIAAGPPALPALRAALEAEAQRDRTEVMAVLQQTIGWISVADAKKAAGLPPDHSVTAIADYSDNMVKLVGADGKVLRKLEQIFGAWDVELLASGNLLVTQFSVSRVSEIDPRGDVVWEYTDLRNPYDADRLPDGNTLITDTFQGRVIEVTPAKQIVWQYDKGIRPFDADRLPDGNTLIADVLNDRVIEVSPDGTIVWKIEHLPSAHDADRLPDGNTLITLRTLNCVIEVDPTGKEVMRISNLNAPSDADRLPDGHTLVAENNMVREFDRKGKEVWRVATTWGVEVNRY